MVDAILKLMDEEEEPDPFEAARFDGTENTGEHSDNQGAEFQFFKGI